MADSATNAPSAAAAEGPLSPQELRLIDAYWRAANYLSVGQIYLLDNPLLRRPLEVDRRQAAAAGPLGNDAGPEPDLRPHEPRDQGSATSMRSTSSGPGTAAPVWSQTRISRAATASSTRASPRTRTASASSSASSRSRAASRATSRRRPQAPSMRAESSATRCSHAYGAAFDNPDLLVCCIVGDGEAETGPLATGWHSNKFLDPDGRRRGPADPAPQRLQDRQPHGPGPHPGDRAARPDGRLRLQARTSSPATTRRWSTSSWRRRSTRSSTRSRRSRTAAALRQGDRPPGVADDRASDAKGLDRAQGSRRQAGRGHVARRTRCRWARSGPTRTIANCSRAGCAATSRRSSSTSRAL